jgi:DNA-binding GntR family transcriptional regulator
VTRFSRDGIRDTFEMRRLLEGEAARLAATRIDRPALARLRALADALTESPDDAHWVSRWVDFDDEFHQAIALAAGSPRLGQDIARYRVLHRGLNRLTTTAGVLRQALGEHYQILEALERRDAAAARNAMAAHVQEWEAYFVNQFPQDTIHPLQRWRFLDACLDRVFRMRRLGPRSRHGQRRPAPGGGPRGR